jgi:DNA-binding CsgD family transcriptional regulator
VLRPDRPVEIDNPLSARELEILRWVAQGKSNVVIADILQISSGTVDTYLRRVFEKLNVADRTSAAVKGVGLGLIAA